jgi:hypothetical protein
MDMRIQVLGEPVSRWVIKYSWILLLVSLLSYFYSRLQTREPLTVLELSYYPALLAAGLLIRAFLNGRLPRTFRNLGDSGSIPEDACGATSERLARRLNHPLSLAVAIPVGMTIVAFYLPAVLYDIRIGIRLDIALANFAIATVDILLAYALGMAVWKATVAALQIRRLGRKGELIVRPFHPDGCGGLLPIGQFCLSLSLILVVFAFFVLGWIAYAHLISARTALTYQMYRVVEPWLVGGLVMVAIVAIAGFFMPMASVHRLMRAEADKFMRPLERLANRVSVEEAALLSRASTARDDEWKAADEQVASLKRHYEQYRRPPTWPIDLRVRMTFLGSQLSLWLGIVSTALSIATKH